MSRYERDYRLPKRVTLNVAAIYLPTYAKSNDGGNFRAAEKLLDHHNIGLQLWPLGGEKRSVNSLVGQFYEKAIPDTKEAYQRLRKGVDDWIRHRATGFPFLIPIIFCDFVAGGMAITPYSSRGGQYASPACLIKVSGASTKDKMTVLHEMGHAALYPNPDHERRERGNLMHEAEPRYFMYRYQVEAFGKAFFARY